jgi:hypothetical protein
MRVSRLTATRMINVSDLKNREAQRNPPLPKNRSERWFSSATNVTTFSHARFQNFED